MPETILESMGSITLPNRNGTGDGFICNVYDTSTGKGARYGLVPQDISHSMNYEIRNASDLDWNSIVKYYLSKDLFKIYSGIIGPIKDVTRTSSPRLDQSEAKVILDGVAHLNKSAFLIKRIKLNQKYLKEKEKYFHYFDGTVTEDLANKLFKSVSDYIIRIPYTAIAVEITPDKSIFIEFRIHETTLHFKLILSNPLEPKAFFALYKDSICLDNGVGPIDDVLNHLLEITHDGVSGNSVAEEIL